MRGDPLYGPAYYRDFSGACVTLCLLLLSHHKAIRQVPGHVVPTLRHGLMRFSFSASSSAVILFIIPDISWNLIAFSRTGCVRSFSSKDSSLLLRLAGFSLRAICSA